jgi:hypothetical protein
MPSAPTSPTEVANLALDIIGTQIIDDVEMPGDDRIASTMNRWYSVSRRKALEGFPWNFASTRATITLVDPAPAFGYVDQYQLPNDFVSLNFIADETLPLDQYYFTIEGDKLLIDNGGDESLQIGYVKDTDDVAKYPATFIMYLAHVLASNTVFILTKNQTVANAVRALEKTARLEAQAVNGKNNPPRAFRESAMLRARRRYTSG